MAELSFFMANVAEDYFRANGPPLEDSYRRAKMFARVHGKDVVSLKEARQIIRSLAADPSFKDYRKPGNKGFQPLRIQS